ncbi:MAG: cytochrome c4 [Gammaproteobacteria bacterium]|nr:cytochrome c4 [Gammaproteobacteria bacterium]
MKKIIVSSFVLFMSLAGVAHAAGDAIAGKDKAAACVGCHGVDGNSMVPTFPNLAGQGEKYIAKQIADFKAMTTRKDDTMVGMSAMLATNQDALDVGAYFAAQKLNSTAPVDESKLALGREIYKGGNLQTGIPACQGCHGPTGAGNSAAGYPQLGGQFVEYLMKQLHAFKDGSRSNDDRAMMRDVMGRMTEAELEAVAHYIASLK